MAAVTYQAQTGLSEVFWRFVKENVGISRVVSGNNRGSSKLQKVLTMEERQERIDLMLKRVECEDNKLDTEADKLLEW